MIERWSWDGDGDGDGAVDGGWRIVGGGKRDDSLNGSKELAGDIQSRKILKMF